ncbi:hypothetical protein RND81_09G032300 [Saponaria officinalis]|uniref:CCHC-type domain-containing protein n=1 Tax=Saponaria officinalis TaxID=3572 RepID=A0AAW1IGG6_SAPOF
MSGRGRGKGRVNHNNNINENNNNNDLAAAVQQLVVMNQNLIQAVTQMNQARNPNAASDMTKAVSLQRPEYFDGKGDPIFTTLNFEENLRIPQATHYLVDNADIWWTENKDRVMAPTPRNDNGVNIVRAMNWEEFKTALRSEFFPEHINRAKKTEFNNLKQGSLTVQEYYNQFQELARFALELVPTPESRASSNVERVFNERNAAVGDKRKNYSGMSEPTQSKTPIYTRSYSASGTANTSNSYFCKKCNRDHHGFYCDGNPWKCAYCGRTGHRTSECRTWLREQAGVGSSVTRPQTRGYQGGNRFNNNSAPSNNARPTTSTATTGAESTGQVNAMTIAQHPQNQRDRAAIANKLLLSPNFEDEVHFNKGRL